MAPPVVNGYPPIGEVSDLPPPLPTVPHTRPPTVPLLTPLRPLMLALGGLGAREMRVHFLRPGGVKRAQSVDIWQRNRHHGFVVVVLLANLPLQRGDLARDRKLLLLERLTTSPPVA